MPNVRDHPATRRLGRRLAVETPEHVLLEFELAGLGSRYAAGLIDGLILLVLLLLALVVTMAALSAVLATRGVGVAWGAALMIALMFSLQWGYFAAFEGLAGGRTPGKRLLGIRVVMDTGRPVSFGAAVTRNLLRAVDAQPLPTGLLGLVVMFLHPEDRRLGDLVAGTIVVRERPEPGPAPARAEAAAPAPMGQALQLTDDEFRLLDQFVARAGSLAEEVQTRFAYQLRGRFRERFPSVAADEPLAFLKEAHALEREARTAVIVAPQARAASAQAAGRGMRLAALKQGRWEAFRRRAAEIERLGLSAVSADEVRAFAASYREVAADLARTRTYGVDPATGEALQRAVTAGHNALYGGWKAPRMPVLHYVFRAFPAAVARGRAYVLAAGLVFALPAAAGYAVLRERPDAAYEILPDVMLSRAVSGRQERGAGKGYAEAPSPFLPLVATSIVGNNVQVAIAVFAFGITAGLGTLLLLVTNGLVFGAALGLFANYGIVDWILTFVAGHGAIELTAIFIAGGAGFRIAKALVAPGDLRRADALVVEGREAIKMVGAAASLLLLAGTIEGFLSASNASASLKLSVGAAGVVLVALYLWQGVWYERADAGASSMAGPPGDAGQVR